MDSRISDSVCPHREPNNFSSDSNHNANKSQICQSSANPTLPEASILQDPPDGALFRRLARKDKTDLYYNHYPSKLFLRESRPIVHFLFAESQNSSGSEALKLGAQKNLVNPPVCPYTPSHKLLLLGEGDFSFTKALATMFGPRHAHNIVATTFDLDGKSDFQARLVEAKYVVENLGGAEGDFSFTKALATRHLIAMSQAE